MTARIPPLLSPYLHLPPEGSLTLLTGILGASANWVLLRYLYAALIDHRTDGAGADLENHDQGDVAVVLVSWMRDWEFWKTEAKRAVGLDLVRLQQEGRFRFVDGLTGLFVPSPAAPIPPSSHTQTVNLPPHRPVGPLPPRAPAPSLRPVQSPTVETPTTPGLSHATSPTLAHTTHTVLAALGSLPAGRKTLLLLDHPNLLLHISSPPVTATALTTALLHLRSSVYATVIALPADTPFLAPAAELASQYGANTALLPPLDTENAAFVVGVAGVCRWVVGCRGLGTGWAEDVSGVVRVTRGGEWEGEGGGEGRGEEGGEWLYFVGGDGGVRVWERGALER